MTAFLIELLNDYRSSRRRFDAAVNSYFPTAAIASGDFSAFGWTIYDPLTTIAAR